MFWPKGVRYWWTLLHQHVLGQRIRSIQPIREEDSKGTIFHHFADASGDHGHSFLHQMRVYFHHVGPYNGNSQCYWYMRPCRYCRQLGNSTAQPTGSPSWSLTCATMISLHTVQSMVTGLDQIGRISCFSGKIVSSLSPINFVPRSTLTARFSTTRKPVSAICCPILVTNLILSTTISGVPAADRSLCGLTQL